MHPYPKNTNTQASNTIHSCEVEEQSINTSTSKRGELLRGKLDGNG